MAIGVALVQVLSLEQEAFKVHVETSCRLQLGLVSDLDHLVLGCSGIKIGVPIIIVSGQNFEGATIECEYVLNV
jgi:hypothetical protein